MAWSFDELAYNLAPLFGPAGQGIANAIQNSRTTDAAKAYLGATDLSQFAAVPDASGIYSPDHLMQLQKIKDARKDVLQQQSAAPVLSSIQQFQADPRWQDAESMQEVAKDPMAAVFNPSDRPDFTGVLPGGKKGDISGRGAANPYIAKAINDFVKGTQSIMDTYNANTGDPMAMARVANSPAAQGFHQVEQGAHLANESAVTNDKIAREKAAMDVYNNTPVTTDPASMEQFKSDVRTAGGTHDATDSLLKEFGVNNDPYLKLSEEQLTMKALAGGPEGQRAQAVLGAMQGRKIQTAIASRPPKSDSEDKYNLRQTDKDFQNDLNYSRSLDRAVASGGKGMIMINGVPTSFDGSAEALDNLKQMQGDQYQTMQNLYPDKMAARKPTAPPAAPAPATGKTAADFWSGGKKK